jgi:hypothetical protein
LLEYSGERLHAELREGQDSTRGHGPDEEAGENVEGVVDTEVDAGEGDEEAREDKRGGEGGVDG